MTLYSLPRRAPRTGLRWSRRFATSPRSASYADTLPNLKIGADTKVLFQGFTGRQATANVKESLEWGTRIVGGVKPGVEGEHLELPVFPSVKVAQEKAKPDASAIYVPGNQTTKAIEEAIEAEIPLVVAVAEHVPIHDILRIHSMLQTQSKTRLVGANCPGIISAIGKCRIGFQPLSCFAPGNVGVVAKSGTLSYETVASITRAGLGQSLCISMGGDVLAGTNFVDALQIFEHDDDTQGIILVGEIGGTAEMDAAEWIRDYRQRTSNPKPIMALVGGLEAPPGRIMGHAGAWAAPGEPDAHTKYRALERAGAVMVNHPEKFGVGMRTLLGDKVVRPSSSFTAGVNSQRRGFHTMRRATLASGSNSHQKRNLYIKPSQAFDILKEKSIACQEAPSASDFAVSISVDRTALSPCIIASPTAESDPSESQRFPFSYAQRTLEEGPLITEVASHLGLPASAHGKLASLAQALWEIFQEKEAFVLETRVGALPDGKLEVRGARFGFDDAAFRSSGRQEDIHRLRNTAEEVPEEVEAEKDGIVYVKLQGEGSIGTLVNGAGLAMNTVDALTIHGGKCANFLDTGGKATSETVKSSFRVICSDSRVNAIFVNIFGGLTRCDMIAEGIIMAFRDLDMKVPVVVRLRGTNEELGQKMIAESGLPLHAFDGFEDAAKKPRHFPTIAQGYFSADAITYDLHFIPYPLLISSLLLTLRFLYSQPPRRHAKVTPPRAMADPSSELQSSLRGLSLGEKGPVRDIPRPVVEKIATKTSSASASKPKKPAKKPVADSWEDEASGSSDDEAPTPRTEASPPPAHAHLPADLESLGGGWRDPAAAGQSSAAGERRRPEKQTAVAGRLIAGALGIRAPKRTEEQRAYDRSVKEQEIKRRNREREEAAKAKEAEEKLKASVWTD
ncbi:hypothetical protein N7512_004011 [Penicillium capsulatum]|nr:hypothetical protein N7512_004011 [Penicillium capsulatum]